jgi:branched-chain amino acid transport system substrate-binding protein
MSGKNKTIKNNKTITDNKTKCEKLFELSMLLVFVALILTGCTGNTAPTGLVSSSGQDAPKAGQEKQENTIRLGSILILTGEGAAWGTASKNGIDMAVEQLNARGGVLGRKIVVDHQDDAGNAKQSVTAFKLLRETKNIDIIIGTTWSHTGLPLVELADKTHTLMVSPSLGMAEFNEGSDFLFNTWPHDKLLSRELADIVFEKNVRKVAMIGAQEVWVKQQTDAFKTRFEELGGEVVLLVEPMPTDKQPYSDALKIKNAADDIDAIVSTTDGVAVGVLVAKRVRELGVDLPIYSITIDRDTIAAADGAYEGLEFLTSLTPTPEFQKKYEEKYGIAIDIGADSAFDAVMMIAQAMEATQSTDPVVLKDYLNRVKKVDGVSGQLIADGKGGFSKAFKLKKVVDGEAVDITA